MRRWWTVPVTLCALAVLAMAVVAALRAGGLVALPGDVPVEARELVERTAAALDTVAVRGTVVTRALTPHGLVTTRAEVHRGDGRVVVRYLAGPAQGTTIYRDGDAVWARGPRGGLRRQAQLGDGWSAELLERNWQFTIVGRRRVAARPTIVFSGRGPGGSLTVAADRATWFPLSLERRDSAGETITATTWQIADFSVAPPPPPEPPPAGHGPPRGERRRIALADLQEAFEAGAHDFTLLEPTWLPPGFELEGWYLHEGPGGVMVEARCTDGLRALLVLQRSAAAPEPPGGGPAHRPGGRGMGRGGGAMRGQAGMGYGPMMHLRGAGGHAVRRVIGDTAATVIGPIRAEDLERVANDLQPSS